MAYYGISRRGVVAVGAGAGGWAMDESPWRRLQAHWAAGPGNQGSVVAVALSMVSAVLLCACCGLTAVVASPRAAAAAQSAHLVLVSTPTPTPNLSSTEVINTPTTATPATVTPTITPTAPTPTASVTASPTPKPTPSPTPRPTATVAPGQPTATPTKTTPTATPQPGQPTPTTSHPTPTATPVPAPTPTSANAGPAVLGAPQAAFVAMYGQPTDNSDANVGRLQFQRFAGTTTDFLVVQLDIFDGQSVRDRAFSITAQHPPDHFWSPTEAQSACHVFLPADARFQVEVKLTGAGGVAGVDDIYTSATLAGIFPAAAFVDAAQNRVAAGTFDVHFTYAAANDSSQIESCQLEVGKQQAPAPVTGNG